MAWIILFIAGILEVVWAIGLKYSHGFTRLTPSIITVVAMAASVLLLVPGFPLINAVADMFKGHINTGLARRAIASLLTLATCIGVVMAMTLWGLRGWA